MKTKLSFCLCFAILFFISTNDGKSQNVWSYRKQIILHTMQVKVWENKDVVKLAEKALISQKEKELRELKGKKSHKYLFSSEQGKPLQKITVQKSGLWRLELRFETGESGENQRELDLGFALYKGIDKFECIVTAVNQEGDNSIIQIIEILPYMNENEIQTLSAGTYTLQISHSSKSQGRKANQYNVIYTLEIEVVD